MVTKQALTSLDLGRLKAQTHRGNLRLVLNVTVTPIHHPHSRIQYYISEPWSGLTSCVCACLIKSSPLLNLGSLLCKRGWQ